MESAIATDCDYLFMLDDDHVIDVEKTLGEVGKGSPSYDFLGRLIQHLKDDPKKGIVGALYYQRGATCDPVIMFCRTNNHTLW